MIQIFGKLTSIIAIVSFIIVTVKFVTKRLKNSGSTFFKRADAWLIKIHKPTAIVLIISGVVHGILSAWYISRVGVLPFIVGIICILSCIASAVFFYLRKKVPGVKSWLFYHRLFAAIALITLFGHILLAKYKF